MDSAQEWGGQQKCFFVSSSLLRLAADTKQTRVDAIPGAKIGHIHNHVNNDATIFKQAETLIIHAGANMEMGSVDKAKPHIEAQTEELGQMLGELMGDDKKVFIVDPICGPWIKEAPGADHWAIIRSRIRKMAMKIKAEWVSLDHVDWIAEEDVATDGVHYSTSGMQKFMEAVSAKVKEVTGKEIMEGMIIQEKPYAEISRAHYRVGCHRCTRHHDGRECPPLAIAEDAELNGSSNTTIQDSFMSANSEGSNAAHNISEESSVISEDASADDDDSQPDQTREASVRLVPIESPDMSLGHSPALRTNSRSSSRSTSAQKRELEKSNGSPTDASGKKLCTNAKSISPKGRAPRGANQKQSKK